MRPVSDAFTGTILDLINLVLTAYMWIIIARAVLSWVNPDPRNPIVRFLYQATEPVLRAIRRRLPTFQLGLDLSPMIVLIGIWVLQRFINRMFY